MKTTLVLMEETGRRVVFPEGQDLTTVEGSEDQVARLRSFDIPVEVESGFDIGFCGSDWVKEKELELGLRYIKFGRFAFGRTFEGPQPKLELIASKDSGISEVKNIEPGRVVLTEYPLLTKQFLEEKGIKTFKHGDLSYDNGERPPTHPSDFRKWCQDEGLVGIRVVHGRIAALARANGTVGVMVNETGGTLEKNSLTVVETIMPIETELIGNIDSFNDERKRAEMNSFDREINEAYNRLKDGESREGNEARGLSGERFL